MEFVIWFFIEMAVLVVVATTISIIIQIIKIEMYMPPGTPPQTNSVTAFYGQDYPDGAEAGEVSPVYTVSNGYNLVIVPYDSVILPNGFTIQYGIDANSNPFVYTTNEVAPIDLAGLVDINQNTATNVAVTYTVNGPGGGTLTYYTTTNASGTGEMTFTTNGTSVDDDGDTATWTPNQVTTNAVIIMRSTNLINWLSISTNEVIPGYVNYFTDTNVFLPSYTTYYNTNTGGGGGGMNPDTNAAGTNGVITIPAGAYYRLEYPSNQTEYLTN